MVSGTSGVSGSSGNQNIFGVPDDTPIQLGSVTSDFVSSAVLLATGNASTAPAYFDFLSTTSTSFTELHALLKGLPERDAAALRQLFTGLSNDIQAIYDAYRAALKNYQDMIATSKAFNQAQVTTADAEITAARNNYNGTGATFYNSTVATFNSRAATLNAIIAALPANKRPPGWTALPTNRTTLTAVTDFADPNNVPTGDAAISQFNTNLANAKTKITNDQGTITGYNADRLKYNNAVAFLIAGGSLTPAQIAQVPAWSPVNVTNLVQFTAQALRNLPAFASTPEGRQAIANTLIIQQALAVFQNIVTGHSVDNAQQNTENVEAVLAPYERSNQSVTFNATAGGGTGSIAAALGLNNPKLISILAQSLSETIERNFGIKLAQKTLEQNALFFLTLLGSVSTLSIQQTTELLLFSFGGIRPSDLALSILAAVGNLEVTANLVSSGVVEEEVKKLLSRLPEFQTLSPDQQAAAAKQIAATINLNLLLTSLSTLGPQLPVEARKALNNLVNLVREAAEPTQEGQVRPSAQQLTEAIEAFTDSLGAVPGNDDTAKLGAALRTQLLTTLVGPDTSVSSPFVQGIFSTAPGQTIPLTPLESNTPANIATGGLPQDSSTASTPPILSLIFNQVSILTSPQNRAGTQIVDNNYQSFMSTWEDPNTQLLSLLTPNTSFSKWGWSNMFPRMTKPGDAIGSGLAIQG